MIRPLDNNFSAGGHAYYKIVAWDNDLPAFDPAPMFKTAFLSPSSAQKFDRIVAKLNPVLGSFIFTGMISRFAIFFLPAHLARVLSPFSTLLHIPGILVAIADMRIDYAKIVMRTFDFCILQGANTLWAITLGAVMNDLRVLVVLVCWINFTCWLLQETYLRNSYLIVGIALCEWMFYVMVLPTLSLELVDDLHHYTFVTARRRKLSTKDVLANVIGTMSMLHLRNLYRRYQNVKHRKVKPQAPMQALGYRTKIALVSGPVVDACVVPHLSSHPNRSPGSILFTGVANSNNAMYLPMQMCLAPESHTYEACDTIWPRIGGLTSVAPWRLAILYGLGMTGGTSAAFSMFLPESTSWGNVCAILSVFTSALFTGIFVCCSHRQLLKRVMLSFHFLFLMAQMITTAFCVMDIFNMRWIPSSGVFSSLMLAFTVLTVDALTPIMKQRLRFQYSIVVGGIVLFWLVESALLLDILVLGNWNLQDRVLMDFTFLGRRTTFYVAPFMLSRVLTIAVWSGRFVYVTLARQNRITAH
ncbi:unnamed protein product [Phytophthora fragariaefolia]|uniref:Unnamed protein product n=1 Tax=Phytophthora fragariaefolia TaxID=1490495 RepID=A0A9W6X1M6_9STRA|nr:unnamed protein product [Phytophthora fragariaefolia]